MFQLGSAIGAEYGLGVAFPASPEKGDFGEASYIHKVEFQVDVEAVLR